uniref:Membrane protein a152 n=1 Tax=Mastomys natalensis cytomegalovirus 2 TaxID=2973540 RepID=A0A9Y1ILV7_9BETA|nr:membrane protein a152 [Mastomys natalensis cytomegalovirus 2]WEG69278.1 membrane protein a152 [Mastomys natalensis cytomegalovirus 2]WEG69417.1 membrane protein a152 [Mastomys natalensis cytomegalovirus 2]WEG69555.1 membrane protein a152 [Mastomys natalensis cytomegalovirus 2]WEG69693.1 membrane protein a152 [Mastomys natalensis cytomegalovirus 2]
MYLGVYIREWWIVSHVVFIAIRGIGANDRTSDLCEPLTIYFECTYYVDIQSFLSTVRIQSSYPLITIDNNTDLSLHPIIDAESISPEIAFLREQEEHVKTFGDGRNVKSVAVAIRYECTFRPFACVVKHIVGGDETVVYGRVVSHAQGGASSASIESVETVVGLSKLHAINASLEHRWRALCEKIRAMDTTGIEHTLWTDRIANFFYCSMASRAPLMYTISLSGSSSWSSVFPAVYNDDVVTVTAYSHASTSLRLEQFTCTIKSPTGRNIVLAAAGKTMRIRKINNASAGQCGLYVIVTISIMSLFVVGAAVITILVNRGRTGCHYLDHTVLGIRE